METDSSVKDRVSKLENTARLVQSPGAEPPAKRSREAGAGVELKSCLKSPIKKEATDDVSNITFGAIGSFPNGSSSSVKPPETEQRPLMTMEMPDQHQ